MAAAPSRLEGHGMEIPTDEGSDVDAEGEEDTDMMDQATPAATGGALTTDAEGSDVDAEGEEVDEEEDGGEPVGAVKIARLDGNEDEEDEDAAVESSSDDAKTSEAAPDSDSESESDAENEWEGQSDTAEEVEAEIVDPNRCVFCGEDEEHDPCEEFEEYLACAVCGDNAHRQCARNANSLKPDNDAENWRCATCVEHGLQAGSKDEGTPTLRRRSSAPKLARDLLPGHRGATKPDSHSVFNTLIHPDDPMDGTRALRKRKNGSQEPETTTRTSTRKRRRPSQPATASDVDDAAEQHTASPVTIRHVSEAADPDVEAQHSDEDGSQALRSSRRTRPRRSNSQKVDQPGALIIKQTNKQLVIAFTNLDQKKLTDVLSSTAKQKRRRERDRIRRAKQRSAAAAPEPEVSHYPAISLSTNFSFQFPSLHDGDPNDIKTKPYGGILTETEADTTKTFPQAADRKRFEDARQKAEEDWRKKTVANNTAPEPSRVKISGPPSKIKCISFGGYEIDTWHAAPYPEEYSRNKVLYICEFCLKYMNSDYVAWRHKLKCPAKHPPGDEIYRDGRFSFFEVDGRKNPVYCQNLCLLAKLFLGSKTLYYDVEPFLFYVMTETDEFGCHFVGYFSKEKRPSSLNNVSCILVLPIHQRKGFGHMLIDFSYLLTRVEKKTGSPEKPLSDMGLVSYRSYWRLILCYQFLNQKDPVSIAKLSERTGMTADDIVSALEGLRALVRDPVSKTYALRLDYEFFRQYIEKFESKNYPQINPDALVWTPYVMGRNNLAHYDEAPAISTVAPRESEDEIPVAPEEGVQAQIAEEAAKAHVNGDSKVEQQVRDPTAASSVLEKKTEPPKSERSPSRRPKTPNGRAVPIDRSTLTASPATPRTNGVPYRNSVTTPSAKASSIIPPTRFEVFPPIPGTAKKRGRPFSSSARRTSTTTNTGTPLRVRGKMLAETPLAGHGKQVTVSTRESLRRTRSKLAEVLINGEDAAAKTKDEALEEEEEEAEAVAEEEADAEMEDQADAQQGDGEEEVDLIKVGTPARGKGKAKDGKGRSPLKGNGKGKAKVSVEDQDADGDIDAIGEDDPDV